MSKIISSIIIVGLVQVLIISSIGVLGTRASYNNPPTIPIIIGVEDGDIGNQYDYEATSTDPNGNVIYYQWDWGDGELSDWIGEYDSGVTCYMSHTWDVQGTYTIKVRAADDPAGDGHGEPGNSGDGLVSDWGTLEVTMPYTLNIQNYQQNLQIQGITIAQQRSTIN